MVARLQHLLGTRFVWHAAVTPDRDTRGEPVELMPQSRYAKADSTPLNRHGSGPFCSFAIGGLPPTPGVYAVTHDEEFVYVGKAQDLKERWGPRGYSTIHPRNCFVGGQSTNCKINHGILLAARAGCSVDLWIHETDDPGSLESRLINSMSPRWNSQRPSV